MRMRATGELTGKLLERLGDFLDQPVIVQLKVLEIQDGRAVLQLRYVNSDGEVMIEQERRDATPVRAGDTVTYMELQRRLSEVFSIHVPRGGGTFVKIGEVVEEVPAEAVLPKREWPDES